MSWPMVVGCLLLDLLADVVVRVLSRKRRDSLLSTNNEQPTTILQNGQTSGANPTVTMPIRMSSGTPIRT